MRCSLPVVLLGGLLLAGCSSDDPEQSEPPNEFQAFDDAVEAYLADNDLSGATAVILTEDEGILHVQGYGGFATDRITLLASSSKIITVGVLMRLADDGLLDLDTPITDYLGDWGEFKTDITVAQLLSNSSGMVGLIEDSMYDKYLCQFFDGTTLADCAETIYSADDADTRVPPDTEFRYGGAQWQLAGGIAEVVSGKSWAELIEEIYLQPCSLTNTGYTNHFIKATVAGDDPFSYPSFFAGDLADLPVSDNPNMEGGGYSTIEDYAQILLMHLRGGTCGDNRVLSEAAVERMQEDRIAEVYDGTTTLDPTMQGYGMGWWLSRTDPIIADVGAYGAAPWMDVERRYAAMFLIEGKAEQGALFRFDAIPIIEEILDAR